MVAMGKTPRKHKQHSFYEKFGKAVEARVVRTMHEPIVAGFYLHDPLKPSCFWWKGRVYPIYRVVKKWRDEWRRLWFRVKTKDGVFDLYEHRRWISRPDHSYRSWWFLAAELEMVPVRHMEKLREQTEKAVAAMARGSSRGAPGGRRRIARGGSRSHTLRSQDTRPERLSQSGR
jgi:hypothetical protein